ncbi:MAG: hypothetical protein AAF266_03700 [Planctomycetota bacterium]
MQRTVQTIAALAITAVLATDGVGSGVGASYYVPGKAAPPAVCSPGQCSPSADCHTCQRLGFACVDHATVAPCTAEGACKPKVETFGWYQPNWRRWPGTADDSPELATDTPEEDSLVPEFEPPAPEEEDKQAPPPIDDGQGDDELGDPALDGFDAGADRRDDGLELNLPSRPELPGRPEPAVPATPTPRVLSPRPGGQPNFGDAPPSLPFGFKPPNPSATGSPDWQPQRPEKAVEATPVKLPATKRLEDGPPALPFGFTQRLSKPSTRQPMMAVAPKYDTAVLPTAAQFPVTR